MGIKIKEKLGKVKRFLMEKKMEVSVAVLLGVTTLLVAWAGWIGSLHSGIQAINFTKSNNLAAEANAEYSVATQVYISDLFTWNTILDLQIDMEVAKEKGDLEEAKVIETKIDKIKHNGCSSKLLEAIDNGGGKAGASPFENEEFASSYFESAKKLSEESQQAMEEGKQDNLRGDSYRLVSVFYSLVLFLLGIVGVIKDYHSRKMILIFSVCILVFAIIYMLTLPMPTGFDISSFFSAK